MTPIIPQFARAAILASAAVAIACHYRAIGKAQGRCEGIATGMASGRAIGYAEGYTDGHADGHAQALKDNETAITIANLRGQLTEKLHRLRQITDVDGIDEAC
ncbi:hypothetical protein AB0O28_19250 [Microbispora sp. NPDC088329]|uniref:hypothetical protein n=1 Tax=Microbispora sp. NPDC088329 TaxID=3154869 RepID=UPI003413527D